jgi:HSP20 family protein
MAFVRWEPFSATVWNRLHNEIDGLFDRFSSAYAGRPGLAVSYPPVNIWEDANSFFIEAELPGMQLDKVEIYVTEGNLLTIQGERHPDRQSDKEVWHRQERGFGPFSRVIALPADVNADKVEARFEHGVLLVTLPKAEHAKPKRITVKGE